MYTDKIIEEMAAEAEVRTGKGKIRAVYFGGGTPTALLTEDLVRLIRACYQYLPLAEDCEFTIEGRMSHFDLEKAQVCLEAGANRISIGVQTFNTAIRRRLGRKHSGDEAFEYLAKLCELDAVIVADLMFGLPNQTDEVWQNDIARATELPLSGLDTYAFNLYPMLPINRMIEKAHFRHRRVLTFRQTNMPTRLKHCWKKAGNRSATATSPIPAAASATATIP